MKARALVVASQMKPINQGECNNTVSLASFTVIPAVIFIALLTAAIIFLLRSCRYVGTRSIHVSRVLVVSVVLWLVPCFLIEKRSMQLYQASLCYFNYKKQTKKAADRVIYRRPQRIQEYRGRALELSSDPL